MTLHEMMQAYLEQRFASRSHITANDVNEVLLTFVEQGCKSFAVKRLEAGAAVDEVNVELVDVISLLEAWRKEVLGRWTRRMDEPFAPTHSLN